MDGRKDKLVIIMEGKECQEFILCIILKRNLALSNDSRLYFVAGFINNSVTIELPKRFYCARITVSRINEENYIYTSKHYLFMVQ